MLESTLTLVLYLTAIAITTGTLLLKLSSAIQLHAMAALRTAVASTLRASARPTISRRTPALVRREVATRNASTDDGGEAGRPSTSPDEPPAGKPGSPATWSMVRKEGAGEAQPRKPDYNVAADYAAS